MPTEAMNRLVLLGTNVLDFCNKMTSHCASATSNINNTDGSSHGLSTESFGLLKKNYENYCSLLQKIMRITVREVMVAGDKGAFPRCTSNMKGTKQPTANSKQQRMQSHQRGGSVRKYTLGLSRKSY
jgi:hypothetical protein